MAHYAVEYGITRHPLAFLFCSFSLFFPDIKCGSTAYVARYVNFNTSYVNVKPSQGSSPTGAKGFQYILC